MNPVELIGRSVARRVIVIGSLPPAARDLDLIARDAERGAIHDALAAHGFERRGRTCARLRDCTADVVELASPDVWALPPAELDALFDQGEAIEPSGMVCRPAPAHAILMLARRALRDGPALRAERRARIDVELDRDPDAFAAAASRASAWGLERALGALEQAYESGRRPGPGARRRAYFEEFRRAQGVLGASVRSWRAILPRPRRGAVLALSPEPREEQVETLAATLTLLAHDVTVARPLDSVGRAGGEPATGWRSALAALRFAAAARRAAWPARVHGRVVLCAGYTADLAGWPAGARRLARVLAPRPAAAYAVGATASEPGVKAVEDLGSAEEVCAALARAAWADLT